MEHRARARRGVAVPLAALAAGAVLVGTVLLGNTIAGRSGTAPSTPAPPTSVQPTSETPADPRPTCTSMVAGLSVRDRLAQRLMIGVDPAAPAAAVALVRTSHVGGIFIGGNPTALLEDGALDRVQAAAPLPVAVAVDDEGGRVQRIDRLEGSLPSARQMARTSPERVRTLATTRGRQLLARGITWNLAPTVDVSDQPASAVIGDRSFSSDPAIVTEFAGAWAEGQRAAGILPVFKHFPGHGHASGDSHLGRVSTPPLDQLKASDLLPYADLLPRFASDQVGVMVGHLDVPGLTGDLPSSLTPATYALLRGEYGFDGVVLTDDLGAMKAISSRFTPAQAGLAALRAGADIALSSTTGTSAGGTASTTLDLLESAVADGRIAAADNDRAVERVLAAKGLCRRG